jgi:ribonuclease HI
MTELLAQRAAAVIAPEWTETVAAHLPALAAAKSDGAVFAALSWPPADVRAVVLLDADRLPEVHAAVNKKCPGTAPDGATLRNWIAQKVVALCFVRNAAEADFAEAVAAKIAAENPAAPVMRECRVDALMAAGIDVRLRVPFLELYSDGARPGENRRGAPGLAGCGWVMLAGPGAADCEGDQVPPTAPCWRRPVSGAQTNQRAELAGLLGALQLAAVTDWSQCEIRTDSMYAMQLALGRWKAQQNKNLVQQVCAAYAAAAARGPLKIIHIRGHGKAAAASARQRRGNDLADAAASAAARGELN